MKLLLGLSYNYTDLINEAASKIGGYFNEIYCAIRTLGNVQSFKSIKLSELMAHKKSNKYLQDSFTFISKVVWETLQMASRHKKSDSSNF